MAPVPPAPAVGGETPGTAVSATPTAHFTAAGMAAKRSTTPESDGGSGSGGRFAISGESSKLKLIVDGSKTDGLSAGSRKRVANESGEPSPLGIVERLSSFAARSAADRIEAGPASAGAANGPEVAEPASVTANGTGIATPIVVSVAAASDAAASERSGDATLSAGPRAAVSLGPSWRPAPGTGRRSPPPVDPGAEPPTDPGPEPPVDPGLEPPIDPSPEAPAELCSEPPSAREPEPLAEPEPEALRDPVPALPADATGTGGAGDAVWAAAEIPRVTAAAPDGGAGGADTAGTPGGAGTDASASVTTVATACVAADTAAAAPGIAPVAAAGATGTAPGAVAARAFGDRPTASTAPAMAMTLALTRRTRASTFENVHTMPLWDCHFRVSPYVQEVPTAPICDPPQRHCPPWYHAADIAQTGVGIGPRGKW